MKLGIGYSDFKKIIDQKFSFVDKSLFIKEFIDSISDEVSVITRPRRFGKTLNLSMLRYFFSTEVAGESTKGLFDNLKIANCGNDINGDSYISHQGQYPVIFITFKDIKEFSFSDVINKCNSLVQSLYREHQYLLNSNVLADNEKNIIQKYLNKQTDKTDIENSIKILSEFLYKHHQQKQVYILIDEYDTPIQSSYINHYYDEMVGLMRGMLGAALKDNIYLNRAVITGVIRVAKESLFSGLNNIKIYSLMQSKYSQYFGFSEEEVTTLVEQAQISEHITQAKEWYNGYNFAGTTVYNPWSIVNFIESKELRPYWVNTSDNVLIRDLMINSGNEFKESFEKLLQGGTCEQLIDEHVVFGDIKQNPSALWSLLVTAGYLNIVSVEQTERGPLCQLQIPNKEIRIVYRNMVELWLSSNRGIQWYTNFLNSLLTGNIPKFADDLEIILSKIVSTRDMGRSETFYQGLMLGFTASLDSKIYEVTSNREGGYGYYDIAIIPKDEKKLGIILELKSVIKIPNKEQTIIKTLEKNAKEALGQIEKLDYVTIMRQRGIKEAAKIGIAFAGKRLKVIGIVGPTTIFKSTKILKASEANGVDKKYITNGNLGSPRTKFNEPPGLFSYSNQLSIVIIIFLNFIYQVF
ncbi:MAG: AAA family ATPase [Oligoflexia bacterium]|nr:AAA family ATPase [Oligoflexia bacterium]